MMSPFGSVLNTRESYSRFYQKYLLKLKYSLVMKILRGFL